MSESDKFLKDFYTEHGQHGGVRPLSKSEGNFFQPVDSTRRLQKGPNTNPVQVLEFHMRKAREEREAKQGKKSEDF